MIQLNDLSFGKEFSTINNNINTGHAILLSSKVGLDREFLLSICGLYKKYKGNIMINNYPLCHNILQMQENTQIIYKTNSFHEHIKLHKQLKLLSLRWSGIDLSDAALKAFKIEKEELQKVDSSKKLYQNKNRTTENLDYKDIMRRLELSRLIACPARIWLLEYPENNLSSKSIKIFQNIMLQRLTRDGIIFLISSCKDFIDITSKNIDLD